MLIVLQDHEGDHAPMTEGALEESLAVDDHQGGYNPLEDATFWTGVAFVVVVGLAFFLGVFKKAAATLDQRSRDIADDLDRARRLREEAQELLATYQRRQAEAEQEAEDIVEQAKRDAKRLEEAARDKIAEQIERRTKAAEDKIARAEAQALAEVRGKAADLAAAAAERIIRDRMDGAAQTALVDKAISGLRGRLN